jgi:hypothetical protein
MVYGSGGVIAAVAAEKRRQALLAEEEMTTYSQDDLANDWEFKIVRSDSAAFRNPQVLNRLIEEEAQAGWTMLEKLDDSRIRFKRPHSDRAKDAYLPEGMDPYRTHYGMPSARIAVLVGVLVGLLALGIFAFLLVEGGSPRVPWISIATLIPLILVVLLGVVTALARRRR